MNTVIFNKEHIYILNPQLITKRKILFCLCCLLFKRLYLFFYLGENIFNSFKIMLFLFKIFLCSSFSSLIFNDSCRLIKKFSSLLRFSAKYLIYLSLSDNRISFFTDTCIKQKFLNILKPASRAI